jgi:DNA-binding transcriptional regulator YdaS (Cro superfamily)
MKNHDLEMYSFLKLAIELAGGQKNFAIICQQINPRVRQGHVSKWLNVIKKLPAQFVLTVEKALEGRVTRYQLRPDIYPIHEFNNKI